MNAIVALCHFCEVHGPSVLFCTQAFHDANTTLGAGLFDTSSDHLGVGTGQSRSRDTNKKHYGDPHLFQRSVSSGSSSQTSGSSAHQQDERVANPATCESCSSIPSGLSGYVSNDHDAKVSYISSQCPFHREIFSIVRQACVRSLSCEVCPGREGPIFFGDENRGHVFSHTFFVKDSQARGFQRWYSVIVVMQDKIFLLNSWPFLDKHLKTVIAELQEKANKIYQTEQAECPQRGVRLNVATGMTPGNFRRQRGSSKSMRSLQELTGDKDVFSSLHLWFTWILKAGGNRMTERLLEGPPTEDTVIDLEKQEETEEGFVLIATKKVAKDQNLSSTPVKATSVSQGLTKIQNVRHLKAVLGREKFALLSYHAIIGNQIVIISDDRDLVCDIIHHLKILLPRGCVKDISYSEEYVDSWKCNFLGLARKAVLPAHISRSELHVVVNVAHKNGGSVVCANPAEYQYFVQSMISVPEKGIAPSVLTKMMNIVENEEFTEKVLNIYFVSLKEEWLNRVKILFKFSRAASRSAEDMRKVLQVLGVHERDKPVLKFWMTGLSSQFKAHVLSATMSQCHGNEGAVS